MKAVYSLRLPYPFFMLREWLLPVFAAIIYMLTYQDKIACIFYRIFSFIFSLITVAPILAWVIVPIFYLADKAPQSDDVTKLIDSSGLSPWAVLLGAIVLFCGCFFLPGRKKSFKTIGRLLNLRDHKHIFAGREAISIRDSLLLYVSWWINCHSVRLTNSVGNTKENWG